VRLALFSGVTPFVFFVPWVAIFAAVSALCSSATDRIEVFDMQSVSLWISPIKISRFLIHANVTTMPTPTPLGL
jgi:hypothetical protein